MDKLCMDAEQAVGNSPEFPSGQNCPIRSTGTPQVVAPLKRAQVFSAEGYF
jgi:hypothetical protein